MNDCWLKFILIYKVCAFHEKEFVNFLKEKDLKLFVKFLQQFVIFYQNYVKIPS